MIGLTGPERIIQLSIGLSFQDARPFDVPHHDRRRDIDHCPPRLANNSVVIQGHAQNRNAPDTTKPGAQASCAPGSHD
jgi:hypothetical protein